MRRALIAVLTAVLIAALTGCASGDPSPPSAVLSGGQPGGAPHQVTLTVTSGSAPEASVTWRAPEGEENEAHAELPWTKAYTFRDGDDLTVHAGAPGQDVTCEIRIDGRLVHKAQSWADPPMVDCRSSIPSR